MSNKDCIVLAFRNLSANKKIIKKIILGTVTIMTLCICFLVIYSSYVDYTKKFKKDKLAKCYYTYRDGNINTSNYKEYEQNLIEKYDVNETAMYAYYDVKMCDDFLLEVGTKEYKIQKLEHVYKGRESHCFINKYSPVYYIFANEETKVLPEYTKNFGVNPLIAGHNPDKAGQVMVSKYLLDAIQYEGDYDELVGRKVSLGDGITDYEICGIYDNDIVEKYGVFKGHIFINPKEEGEYDAYILGYYNDFEGFVKYIREHNIFEPEEDFYLTKEAIDYSLVYWVINYMGKLILCIGLVVCFVVFFTMIYLLDFYYDRRGKYFSMLRCVGMLEADQTKLAFFEINIAFGVATFFGVYFAFMILMLFKIFVAGIFNFAVIMNPLFFALAVVLVGLLVNITVMARKNKYGYL